MPRRISQSTSRRNFLKQMTCAPFLFLPAPLVAPYLHSSSSRVTGTLAPPPSFADVHLKPHYPNKSPLDDILRFSTPGTDAFVTEGYAFAISQLLRDWGRDLAGNLPAPEVLNQFVDPAIQSTSLSPIRESRLRQDNLIQSFRRTFSSELRPGRDRFLHDVKIYLASLTQIE